MKERFIEEIISLLESDIRYKSPLGGDGDVRVLFFLALYNNDVCFEVSVI